MKKSLVKEYDVLVTSDNAFVDDYNVFRDKELLDSLRNKILENIIDNTSYDSNNIDEYINTSINDICKGYDLTIMERNHIYNMITNEINGYGPLNELLLDKNITEIMVNSPDEIYVEIDGKIVRDNTVSFINDAHILRIIQKIVGPIGKTIDSKNPMVDARLSDGSRVNAIIPPLSIKGPVITIRKFKDNLSSVEDLLRNGTLTNDMAIFLEACVKSKLNIIVNGGTGSGKTTILNILSSFINEDERIITIEDASELKLKQNHVISLETRNSNYGMDSMITIRDLVRNSLRMRPDRIIVGEVRGEEAFDMLQAMNTGHEGSLTTLHANSPIDALNRLESMILMSVDIPVNAVREYIKNAINIVINVSRLSDGRRKITSINEIVGINDNNEIELNKIFSFVEKGTLDNGVVDGAFEVSKKLPKVLHRLEVRGFDVKYLFKK